MSRFDNSQVDALHSTESEVGHNIGPREYVYNLLPRKALPTQNNLTHLPKIRNTHADEERKHLKSKMNRNKTMGPPSHIVCLPSLSEKANNFLRKQTRRPYVDQKQLQSSILERKFCPNKPKVENLKEDLADTVDNATESTSENKKPTTEHRRKRAGCCSGTKPLVPLQGSLDPENQTFSKTRKKTKGPRGNFIERNSMHAITMEPGKNLPKFARFRQADTRHGDIRNLESEKTHSGLSKRYVWKPQLGRMPVYLVRRLQQIRVAQEHYLHYKNETETQFADYLLTPEQRNELLQGLKAAWDKYNRAYLGLSSSSDTLKTKAYKQYLEGEMDQLEKDINLVERHQFLFVDSVKPTGPVAKITQHMQMQKA
ncbi:unnamed protein product [Protopolystoma xenopodis]|uniref:Enkurin domain-containing protein n=1 Tax=Protopolystoma xenopodis TaxID=117903 RepID=A0A448WAB2_9PLAT|nr:unnamed protein product [Protopolystoma xenopodis]